MTKKNKAILTIVLSFLVLSITAYSSGFRLSSKQLVNEYIKESGLKLIKEPIKMYKEKNLESYLLESKDFYVNLGFQRYGFLWKFPKQEINFNSETFGHISGKIIINEKEAKKDIFFLNYPSMYFGRQTFENVTFKSFLISQSKTKQAYIFKDGEYSIIPFKQEKDDLYSIESELPSYIENDDGFKALFPRYYIDKAEELIEVNLCNEAGCQDKSFKNDEINQFIALTDEIGEGKVLNEVKNKFKERIDLEINFKNPENHDRPTQIKYHYDKDKKITYACLPEHYEVTSYNEDGSSEDYLEDAYFSLPYEIRFD